MLFLLKVYNLDFLMGNPWRLLQTHHRQEPLPGFNITITLVRDKHYPHDTELPFQSPENGRKTLGFSLGTQMQNTMTCNTQIPCKNLVSLFSWPKFYQIPYSFFWILTVHCCMRAISSLPALHHHSSSSHLSLLWWFRTTLMLSLWLLRLLAGDREMLSR